MLRYRIRAATSVINRLAQSVGRYGFSEETSSVNRREIYNLLFQSVWAAINQTVESEQGYQPAALLVLHSWNQKLLSPRVPQGIGASLEARRTEVDRRVRFAPRETGLACVHRQVEGDGMGQLHPASAAASEQRTEFG